MKRVVGLDLSLSSTGIAIFTERSETPVLSNVRWESWTPHTVEEELTRIKSMGSQVVQKVTHGIESGDDTWFVFEGAALNSSYSGKFFERAGLWWIIALNLQRHGRLVQVRPNTLKSYWTGKGNAPKGLMVAWAQRRYPDLYIRNHDTADALALAHMGARVRGLVPSPRPPEVDATMLTHVAWPTD